ncbi:MAG: glycosyltransferase family 2 protein [Planctomycetota bacterium]
MPHTPPPSPQPRLSVVVPAMNERDNLGPLADEVAAAVASSPGLTAELIVVDDGSTDDSQAVLAELAAAHDWVRPIAFPANRGQSAAMAAGIAAARAPYIATLDADLQNDPADLPRLLDLLIERQADLVQGDRSRNRRDHAIRRWTSAVGRAARAAIVGDRVRDTGCSARVMTADHARRLPLAYKGMHRFIPACIALQGGVVVETAVNHRPRHAGTTKYGLGIGKRAWSGLIDCFAVAWMRCRSRPLATTPLTNASPPPRAVQAPPSAPASPEPGPTLGTTS